MRSLARDFGREYDVSLWTDSSAANGIGNRRGAGGVRHIETRSLWLQQRTTNRDLSIGKISKDVNWADLPTKHQDGRTVARILKATGYEVRQGRSALALQTT